VMSTTCAERELTKRRWKEKERSPCHPRRSQVELGDIHDTDQFTARPGHLCVGNDKRSIACSQPIEHSWTQTNTTKQSTEEIVRSVHCVGKKEPNPEALHVREIEAQRAQHEMEKKLSNTTKMHRDITEPCARTSAKWWK
jgi:hypothetical protein